MFYYPIVIFSVYQLSLGSVATDASIALAALSLVILGLLLPIVQLYRIRRHTVPRTRSGELVDDLPTILALGPLYNTFAERNELFFGLRLTSALVSGIVIGAAQNHGLAQAIVILCVELAETSMTVCPSLGEAGVMLTDLDSRSGCLGAMVPQWALLPLCSRSPGSSPPSCSSS